MKPHVCPKCDGEALRMMSCAPCRGAGIVWQPGEQVLAPNPYIQVYPQPYVYHPEPNPNAPTITWGNSFDMKTTPSTFVYTSDGPITHSSVVTLNGTIQ